MSPTATLSPRFWSGPLLLAAIAWIHFRDIPDKFGETPSLGWL